MTIETNNTIIYSFLENENQLPKDFDVDCVIDFEHKNCFYILVYESISRNFILLSADNYIEQPEELNHLLNELNSFNSNDFDGLLIEMAIKIVENKILSKNNSSFFFDAH